MRALAVACLLLLALALAGCGRERPSDEPLAADTTAEGEDPLGAFEEEALSGRLSADGSSTVAPLMSLAAERFRKAEPGVKITVGTSGTGGGFERFCRGETDLSNASRPIKEEEEALCAKEGVASFPVQVANDGIAIVVNKKNTWATCLTVDQLKKIWEPGSKVDNWRDVDPKFPDVELELFGAGTDSGTFDYFTEAIVGEEGASRTDYTPSEDDNITVRGVSGVKGALGYFGLSYYTENVDRLKALAVDGGDGCVEPSVETRSGRVVQAAVTAAVHLCERGRDRRKACTRPLPHLRTRQRGADRQGREIRADDGAADRRSKNGLGERRGRCRGMKPRSPDRHHTATSQEPMARADVCSIACDQAGI